MHAAPLAEIRVLDLGLWRPVPYAGQLLAELGAEVTKIEPPDGDPQAAFPDIYGPLNERKRVLRLDLKDEAGQRRALDLAVHADVVLEGFRPGVVDRLGLGEAGVRRLNPSVVYASVSGFGQDGPLRDVPGHDINYQAQAGLLLRSGEDPSVPRLPLADLAGGTFAALAVCAALVRRATSGRGERIDVSMTDVLATWGGLASATTVRTDGRDRKLRGYPTYDVFRCRDGRWLAIGMIGEENLWQATVRGLGLPDDVACLGAPERLAQAERVHDALGRAFSSEDRDVLVARLQAVGAPVSLVLEPEQIPDEPLFRERGLVVDGPDGPRLGHPVRFLHNPLD